MTMRYLREPRGLRKQWVYQRSIPSKLQAYDRGRNGKSRKQIEIGLGRSRAEAIANYQSVHEQQEERFSRLKQYFLNGTQPSYRIEQLQSFCRELHIEDQSDPIYEFNAAESGAIMIDGTTNAIRVIQAEVAIIAT